jgi:uncharacterized protein (TIGR00369 family)
VDPTAFLRSNQEGLDGLLGVEIVSAAPDRIVGQLAAGPQHMTGGGRVHGGAVMAFADSLGAYGAVLNLPEGCTTATIESKTNFLRRGQPGILIGESVPLHVGRTTMVWQTTVRDSENEPVAQVTQTQIVLKLRGREAERPALPAAASREQVASDAAEPGNGDIASVRKKQIFRAASEVMARKGFARATMREIARAAGMPVPTMYQYLRSKDDLLALIFDTYLAEIERSVSRAVAEGRTATEKLTAAIRANLASFDIYQRQIRLMNRETQALNADARERVKQHMRSYLALFSRIIDEGVARGEFRPRDPELVANFIAMLCEVWPLRHWSIGQFGLAKVQDEMLALVTDGLLRPKAGTR